MDFRQLRVRFTNQSDCSLHTIHCRRHVVRQSSELTPNDVTIFTLGWPPYCSGNGVEEIFSRVGHVLGVYLQPNPGPVRASNDAPKHEEGVASSPGGFQVGYVVFSSQEEATRALNLCLAVEPIPCRVGPVGLDKWCREYMAGRPGVDGMQGAVERCVGQYDLRKAEEKERRKRLSEPDQEGWITVVRKAPRLQVTRHSKKKRKKQEILNFYCFQQREAQRQQIADLRRRFEEDKRRVAAMKARRKFKPF